MERTPKKKGFRHGLNPEKIILDGFAFARTRVLITAIDLDLFTHISNGKKAPSELAQITGAHMRPLVILLNALCAMEYLQKKGGLYELTPLSRFFLVKNKRMYFGNFLKHIDLSWGPWFKLIEVVSSGKPSFPVGTESKDGFEYYKQLVPLLFNTSYLVAVTVAKALGIGKEQRGLKIIDVGTGSGAWGIAMAQEDATSQIYGVDDPKVLEQTQKHVGHLGLEKQFHYIPANIEEDSLGEDEYDLAVLGYVFHAEGEKKSREILSKIYQCLKMGGRIIICEFCPDENREKNLFPLLFGVQMLIHTTDGNTFSISEYTSWLYDAGFKKVETIDIPATSSVIVATK